MLFSLDVGLTFIVYPAAISYFPVSSLWSVLFFLMLVMMGLGTLFSSVETIVTAIIDENSEKLKKKRIYILLALCIVEFLLGLPLTSQVTEIKTLVCSSFPSLSLSLCVCLPPSLHPRVSISLSLTLSISLPSSPSLSFSPSLFFYPFLSSPFLPSPSLPLSRCVCSM